jgi:hypothetical protein
MDILRSSAINLAAVRSADVSHPTSRRLLDHEHNEYKKLKLAKKES